MISLTRPVVLLLRLIALPVEEEAEAEPEREDAGEEEAAAQRAQDLPAPQRHEATSRNILWTGQQCRHLEEHSKLVEYMSHVEYRP